MTIKWNKTAVKNIITAIEFIEENGYPDYAEKPESEILTRINTLSEDSLHYLSGSFPDK